ncbi:MAG: iron chelate uptake ABC transporter family permease subunit [Subdoligranulum sp.]
MAAKAIPLLQLWQAWCSGDPQNAVYRVLLHVRWPRTLAGLLAGSALAAAGVLLQAVLNNAMASPNVIGVNAGAGLAALCAAALWPAHPNAVQPAAFAGALAAALLVYGLALGAGVSRTTLVLAGLAVSGMLTAGMNTIKLLYPDAIAGASDFLVGGLSGVTLSGLKGTVLYLITGTLLALLLAADLNVLCLGEQSAASLGLHIGAVRFLGILAAALLAGAAVSFAGLLSFVGLLAPHIARRLVGNNHRILLPAAMLLGAAFVVLCDVLARCLFAPFELPVGILLSLIGGPFFLGLLLHGRGGECMIELQHVSAGYGAQDVVRDVSFAAPNGQLTALIGPNGSGKTTLLRAMTRTLPCRSGNILLDDRSIASYGRKEFARTAAFMPQSRPVPGITVRALVAHGRFPYLGFSRRMTAQDTAAVEQAMRRTGTLDWANRDVRALSGGERQRVYLAMALAQGGTTILLDEPGAFLDVRAQFELLDLLRSVAAGGKAVVLVMHELPQAMQYADRIALLGGGRLLGCDTSAALAATGAVDRVFGVRLCRAPDGVWYVKAEG